MTSSEVKGFRKLFYMPLEPYKERYTCQLSRPITGWLERNWRREGIHYERIYGESLNKQIKVGSVLDACGRGYWATTQIANLLKKINAGEVTTEDVIYFDDFWHPGFFALPYAFHLMKIWPRMYAMLHAQSVDIFDFTHPMRHWMRHAEIAEGKLLRGIFVTSTCLRDLCLEAGVGNITTVHLCGLPYCSEEVEEQFPIRATLIKKEKQVVFSSRWDEEKDPRFYLRVVDEVINGMGRKDIKFIVTTSADQLRSNNKDLLITLQDAQRKHYGKLVVYTGLSKREYYETLLESAVQFNCADQDFVSWTLLEATTCGCYPVYPYFRSFPEALAHSHNHLYVKNDVQDAARKIIKGVDYNEGLLALPSQFEWVFSPFDISWKRMLAVMRDENYSPLFT